MKLKLYRDKVQSATRDGFKVGVYIKPTDKQANEIISCEGLDNIWLKNVEILLAEMSPEKADKIIKIWNER